MSPPCTERSPSPALAAGRARATACADGGCGAAAAAAGWRSAARDAGRGGAGTGAVSVEQVEGLANLLLLLLGELSLAALALGAGPACCSLGGGHRALLCAREASGAANGDSARGAGPPGGAACSRRQGRRPFRGNQPSRLVGADRPGERALKAGRLAASASPLRTVSGAAAAPRAAHAAAAACLGQARRAGQAAIATYLFGCLLPTP